MAKLKILVLPSDRTGVGKFRSVDPHIHLQKNYPDDFHVDIDYEPKYNDAEYWKQYDIVHFHRTITPNYEISEQIIPQLNNMGIVTVCDIDDYWNPGKEHPAHNLIVTHKIDEKIRKNISLARYVTTTTPHFAQEIKKINKNVFVIPNGIDPEEEQYSQKTEKSDKLRFGWLGGSSHLHDIMLLEGTISKLHSDVDKFQFYLCGFDIRGTVTEIDPVNRKETKRDILPHETVWVKYEKILTENYRYITKEHREYLEKFIVGNYEDKDAFYHRVWTESINEYGKNYTKFDVSLAPLKDTMFNRMKSQLKVIEAGFYKKALIASEIAPYTIDLTHSIEDGNFINGNALIVRNGRNKSDWAKYMKKLIQNPSWAEDLGERLYETVNGKYDLRSLSKLRRDIYKNLK
jgi:glycosyltransferase involved in cell wall biosynthesis